MAIATPPIYAGPFTNDAWKPAPIDPLALVNAMVLWHGYFESRGYKDWHEACAHFASVAKLTGEIPSDLMLRDFRAHENEVKND